MRAGGTHRLTFLAFESAFRVRNDLHLPPAGKTLRKPFRTVNELVTLDLIALEI